VRPQFGFYAAIEVLDSDYVSNHFSGRSPRQPVSGVKPPICRPRGKADLVYRGNDPNAYRSNYFNRQTESEDNWSDLVELTRVLTETPDAQYAAEVNRVLHAHEWLRYFAVNALLDNNETGIYNGIWRRLRALPGNQRRPFFHGGL